MYEEHPVFKKPEDENIKIWRYLDFTKFVSLLDKQALFFTRANKLQDKFEGSYSKANVKLRPIVYKDKIPKKVLDGMSASAKEIKKYVGINSWHRNENESAAMWKLYLKSNEGVAIRSTFKRLTESFHNCLEDTVLIGKIHYIDYSADWLPEGNALYPFMHKRKSFVHERELRALIFKEFSIDNELDCKKDPFDFGQYVSVDLNILIERIFVSPPAEEWFYDLVKSIVNKYDLGKDVIQSSLADDPVY